MKLLILGILLITSNYGLASNRLTSEMLDDLVIKCTTKNKKLNSRKNYPKAYFLHTAIILGQNEDELIGKYKTKITDYEDHVFWTDLTFKTWDLVHLVNGRKLKIKGNVVHQKLKKETEVKATIECSNLKESAWRIAAIINKNIIHGTLDRRCLKFHSMEDEYIVHFSANFGEMDENGECGDPHYGLSIGVNVNSGELVSFHLIDA